MSETSIMLKLVRKMFQCNDIIFGIIDIIDALVQQQNVRYDSIDNETLLDIIHDFSTMFNNRRYPDRVPVQKTIGVTRTEPYIEKKGSGLDKIH